jgi:hypothetical protein
VLIEIRCVTCGHRLYRVTEAHLLDHHVTAVGGGLPVPVICDRDHPRGQEGLPRYRGSSARSTRVFIPIADLRPKIEKTRRTGKPQVHTI